ENAKSAKTESTLAERVVSDILDAAIRAHEGARGGDLASVVSAARVMLAALKGGRKVLAFGNGGSAADAQHFAAELVGRFERERRAAAAIALVADTSILTAVANDHGFERVFARQIEALGAPGDVALGISTSGRSPNVLAAFDAARARGLTTIALTGGDGGPIGRAADVHVNVAGAPTARAQEVHRTILHAVCELIEREL
ncbi:MAG TPA: SIS domain-containing protein, partial [Vicinamibacterales bacterium]|nr:SIS domain-containing protein [Vicinamibacterales bacterium]